MICSPGKEFARKVLSMCGFATNRPHTMKRSTLADQIENQDRKIQFALVCALSSIFLVDLKQ